MPSEAEILEAACAILRKKGAAKARELVRLLCASGSQIDKSTLNGILYRHRDTGAGLRVDEEGVWSCAPAVAQPTAPMRSETAALPSRTADVGTPSRAAVDPAYRVPSATQIARGTQPSLPTPPKPPASFEISEEQRAIVEAPSDAWTLVEAGPGTGKTAVALARVAALLERGVPPTAILMVSFTRTAVAELRQRIEALSHDVGAAAAVRITTLDAEAWNLGINFGGGRAAEKLAAGFDGNIEEAIRLFESNDPALGEWVDQTRHVIVDEAQDLVGRRSELVFQLLDHLPDGCGVTVFVDPAQAIYGFADGDDDDDDDDDGTSPRPRASAFHEKLEQAFPEQFRRCCLTRLYRSSNPALCHVFEQGRATVLGTEPAPERLTCLHELATTACEPAERVDLRSEFGPDELVLFRRRSEVLLASSFLSTHGVPHRIRMGQIALGGHAWLACLFGRQPAALIGRDELARRWQTVRATAHLRGLDEERSWTLLVRLAGAPDGQAIDLRALRWLLSRPRPPAELSQTEVGMVGPILGTIHASKGREANTVSLMLAAQRSHAPPTVDLDEEVRVSYVGTTRARRELFIGHGYAGHGFKTLDRGGRVYRSITSRGKQRVQVEVGRLGDLDEVATVSRQRWSAEEVERGQAFLAAYEGMPVSLTVEAGDDHVYLVRTTEGSIPLGALSKNVGHDLFAIGDAVFGKGRRKPPRTIPHVSLIGVRTFAVQEDHPRIAEIHEPWATTGVFLVPVIRALATCSLPPRFRGTR